MLGGRAHHVRRDTVKRSKQHNAFVSWVESESVGSIHTPRDSMRGRLACLGVWSCTDFLPPESCDLLGVGLGVTYGGVARDLCAGWNVQLDAAELTESSALG